MDHLSVLFEGHEGCESVSVADFIQQLSTDPDSIQGCLPTLAEQNGVATPGFVEEEWLDNDDAGWY